ncbi:hypothetical protein HVPorG_05017 [Roseomonas mucosa]|nr:hypothetical protein HVPorG_05017 [Roseomonas mucosa]
MEVPWTSPCPDKLIGLPERQRKDPAGAGGEGHMGFVPFADVTAAPQ